MPPAALVDLAEVDTSKILYDLDAIRRVNPQRFEMEQLSAIVHVDKAANLIVGYKDLSPDEFWVRGHMPGFPLMPGVIMCESAAQLCSFYCHLMEMVKEGGFIGFAGMEEVRFRDMVKPGDRLVMIAKAERLRPRQTIFDSQGFVDGNLVFNGRIIGVPLSARDAGR